VQQFWKYFSHSFFHSFFLFTVGIFKKSVQTFLAINQTNMLQDEAQLNNLKQKKYLKIKFQDCVQQLYNEENNYNLMKHCKLYY